jgi:hypothetical protein
MSVEHPTTSMLMDHISRYPCSSYVIKINRRIVHVLKQFMGRGCLGFNLRLEVRRIRYGASRDRHGDVVWLYFTAPHSHLYVDVTVTSARTNSNVLAVGAPLPLQRSLAKEAHHSKLDADLRTSASLGTPSV